MKLYNYVVYTNDAITKHMFSDMERYDWLTCLSGNCGQVLWADYRIVSSANNFNILNCRPAKFGIGNVYGLLYKVTYRLVIIVFWRSSAAFLG